MKSLLAALWGWVALTAVVVVEAKACGEPPALTPPPSLPAGEVREAWLLVSETSAILYWQTENRARSRVLYGKTPDCLQQTDLSDLSPVTGQPYWTHFHRLQGLETDQTYYFHTVSIGIDGTKTVGELNKLHTKRHGGARHIPADVPGPPYVLDRANATYVLTQDLRFPLGGLTIQADGVILDMDGHTLVYNDAPADRPTQWDKRAYEGHDFGIKVAGRFAVTVLNGVIRQGRGNTRGTAVGIGCNPLLSLGPAHEIAGLEIAWSGDDISGMVLYGSQNDHIHHCVFDDRGTVVSNRHMGIHSVAWNQWGNYDHNLVKATRQQGLAAGAEVTHNEVYVHSRATNSFGVQPTPAAGRPVMVAHNRILGIGQHPVGIGMFGVFPPGSAVHHNWVEVKCTERGDEFGHAGSACFRTTWGADGLDVGHNTFIAHADMVPPAAPVPGKADAPKPTPEPVKARAVWVGLPVFTPRGSSQPLADARGFFHDNRIVADGPEGTPAGAVCIVCNNESPHLIFKGNTVLSTWGNVLLADCYGHADGYAKFVGNVFSRLGRTADYQVVRQEYGGRPATGVFLACRYSEGNDGTAIAWPVAEDSDTPHPALVKLQEQGRVVFQEILDITVKDVHGTPLAGATVTIHDEASGVLFRDVTPEAAVEAMLISRPGASLDVTRPARPAAREAIETLSLSAGQVKAVLTTAVAEEAKWQTTPRLVVRAAKPGFQPAQQRITPGKPSRIEIVLAK